MTDLFWRGDPAQLIPFREWCREKLPQVHDKFAVIDLDVIMRTWTATDPSGHFLLVEMKTYGRRTMTGAQRMTFGLFDQILSVSDRYHGFYLLSFSGESFDDSEHVWLNNVEITEDEAIEHFSLRQAIVPRYEFGSSF